MSKLTDIKNRIDQMDGGSFRNICDAYLSYMSLYNPLILPIFGRFRVTKERDNTRKVDKVQ